MKYKYVYCISMQHWNAQTYRRLWGRNKLQKINKYWNCSPEYYSESKNYLPQTTFNPFQSRDTIILTCWNTVLGTIFVSVPLNACYVRLFDVSNISVVWMWIYVSREYWTIFREPGFLAVVCFGSSPTPSPLSRRQIVSLSQPSCVSPVNRREMGVGEEPNHATARKPCPL